MPLSVRLRPPEMGIVVDIGAFWRDWAGGTVLGGLFCLGRVLLLRVFPGCGFVADVITLLVKNRPPPTELPFGNQIALLIGGDGRFLAVYA